MSPPPGAGNVRWEVAESIVLVTPRHVLDTTSTRGKVQAGFGLRQKPGEIRRMSKAASTRPRHAFNIGDHRKLERRMDEKLGVTRHGRVFMAAANDEVCTLGVGVIERVPVQFTGKGDAANLQNEIVDEGPSEAARDGRADADQHEQYQVSGNGRSMGQNLTLCRWPESQGREPTIDGTGWDLPSPQASSGCGLTYSCVYCWGSGFARCFQRKHAPFNPE
jgi:hypothetical protein